MAPGLCASVKRQPLSSPRTSRHTNLSPTATIRRGRAHSCEPSAIDTTGRESLAGVREPKYASVRLNMQTVTPWLTRRLHRSASSATAVLELHGKNLCVTSSRANFAYPPFVPKCLELQYVTALWRSSCQRK